jgi:hypothetical protein
VSGDYYDHIREQMVEKFDEIYEECIDNLVKSSEYWPSDSSTDILARGIIGTMRPILDALKITMKQNREDKTNTAVFQTALSLYMQIVQHLAALDNLGELRK